MSFIAHLQEQWEFNRGRTFVLLEQVEELADPQAALSWQPGVGRAHVGWHLLHIAATEENFATVRLRGEESKIVGLIENYGKGSIATADVPSPDEIKATLSQSRENLLDVFSQYSDDDLSTIPPGLADRGWDLNRLLKVIAWHEPHHQGQAHAVLNLYKASQTS
ncbi:DinB family protein [Calycomorphotria hydatis]|uniref:DinB superfamily protein n=1 Tax=Calycomorphotria hydatis TaxID=2528027 RepID=A0A517T7W2_9PLAN|nr:DinB family protein [Calycomorphotria hydatis]QDT64468.1 DinB superfamily protein [Calycomorphotria hydatis]